jgi:hypothetical protein
MQDQSRTSTSLAPLRLCARGADRHVARRERPVLLGNLERDVEVEVALLLGDLHQDWCPHEATIVDRGVFDENV